MIRALVVDDSAFMRKAIAMMLESDPGITVVDTARDGLEAIDKVAALRPDVVTMDVEMPRMDGLTALERIMTTTPVPVLMISSLTREGADATLRALAAGAVDFLPKESATASLAINQLRDELIVKVRAITGRRAVAEPSTRAAEREPAAFDVARHAALVIGTSTGGPNALQQIIPALPAAFPLPVLVVQHMPPHFTRSLAERLDAASALSVREASEGDIVSPGTVYVARGGINMCLEARGGSVVVRLSEQPDTLHKPSVDVLFRSAADAFSAPIVALVLTGMGRDGREGCAAVRQHGGFVLAQDADTCVVYGMPRAVTEAGLANVIRPLGGIVSFLTNGVRTGRGNAAPARPN